MCGCGNGHTWEPQLQAYFATPSSAYQKIEEKDLEIWIDDYFNIYIPALKTYLVYNYSKIPLYAFFINMDHLGLYDKLEGAIQFNADCPEDLAEYNGIIHFINSFPSFLDSEDHRQQFKTIFPQLLTFYKYDIKQKHFAQFQSLSENLEQLAPSGSGKRPELEDVEKENTTMNDEHKLFAQSQRIRELEIQSHKNLEELEVLRKERDQHIEVITEHQHNTESFKALLEELNEQLHGAIDQTSIDKKTIIGMKTKMLGFAELTHKYRRLEDVNHKQEGIIDSVNQELLQLNTLNNSLVDKQVEASQKLDLERAAKHTELDDMKALRLIIMKKDSELSQYSIKLESEKQLHEQSKEKLEKMFSSIQNSTNITDEYPKLLLKQIQDKNAQIEQLRIEKVAVEKSKEVIANDYTQLKRKVSSLIN